VNKACTRKHEKHMYITSADSQHYVLFALDNYYI